MKNAAGRFKVLAKAALDLNVAEQEIEIRYNLTLAELIKLHVDATARLVNLLQTKEVS